MKLNYGPFLSLGLLGSASPIIMDKRAYDALATSSEQVDTNDAVDPSEPLQGYKGRKSAS